MKEITVIINGQSRQLAPQTTLEALLQQLEMADKRIAVELNGEIIPKSQHPATVLQADDRLEIVVAVGGG